MIAIWQYCDGCDKQRALEAVGAENNNGWRAVQPNKHLCPACIAKALNTKENN